MSVEPDGAARQADSRWITSLGATWIGSNLLFGGPSRGAAGAGERSSRMSTQHFTVRATLATPLPVHVSLCDPPEGVHMGHEMKAGPPLLVRLSATWDYPEIPADDS
jgi:hypothetical protein